MAEIKVVDQYFQEIQKSSRCKITNQITGMKYDFSEEKNRGEIGEIQRFFIDDNLDASISRFNSKKTSSFNYIHKSDLLIIGFCLDGKKIIKYGGKNTIKKGEVFYFRPREDFQIKSCGHSFLYYFLDLNYFKKSLSCKKYGRGCKNLYCSSYGDLICKEGELIIENLPYAMRAYGEEIEKIGDIEVDNFLEYTNLKGQLFNYLNWFIKLRLTRNSTRKGRGCGSCYATRAKKIIIDNIEDSLTVKELAERLDVSIYRLQNSFKKVEGTTVYNYIRKAKIDHSKILLEKSDLLIIDISQKIGYENPSKFSTAFKDVTGYTPSEYRELMGN